MLEYPVLSPFQEGSAYEALWDRPKSSFQNLSKQLQNLQLPSSLIEPKVLDEYKKLLLPILKDLPNFGIRVDGDGLFPEKLKDVKHPVKLLYYLGNWELVHLPSVAVVGTRNPTAKGLQRTRILVKKLVEDRFVIVSGLARGIDTTAHRAAIDAGGSTIGVIGTSLNQCYPSENRELQREIGSNFLLISQVPFLRADNKDYRKSRFFFPARNIAMSALTQATIIVEAGETSGTLIQAEAALQQGRKLFVLENNFLNPHLSWPQKLEKAGAIRVKDYDDIRKHLLHPAS